MEFIKAIALGIIQGLTEFLPISSSGHLVLGQRILNINDTQVFFDIILHLGTLAAICIVLRKEIWSLIVEFFKLPGLLKAGNSLSAIWKERQQFRLLIMIVVGSIPTGLIGFYFKELLESLFASTIAVGLALLFTGLVLFSTRLIKHSAREAKNVGVKDALLIGLVQGLAIIPGLSRSGLTISTGLLLGIDKDLAVRYSFLLSIPAVLGAILLQITSFSDASFSIFEMGSGFLAAFFTGYFALLVLFKIVLNGKLHLFAYYCWALGLLTLALSI